MTMFNKDDSDQSQDGFEDYKKRFVKEDGSADLEALLKKSYHQEKHIVTLEDEHGRFRDELRTRETLEATLAKLTNNSSDGTQNPPNDPPLASNPDVNQVVQNHLSAFEQKLLHKQNTDYVVGELTKSWGPDYVGKLRAKAKELGESEAFLEDLAAKKPKAFLALVNPQIAKVPDYAPPQSEIRTASGVHSTKTYADFQKIRKENPELYQSAQVQDAMFKAAKAAAAKGEDFYKKQ